MDIVKSILDFMPRKHKSTPSGWVKFNAVCCIHNGQTIDTRMRSGIMKKPDGLVIHCFNCKFSASYVEGQLLSMKMRSWLSYAGASDTEINNLVLASIKLLGNSDTDLPKQVIAPTFPTSKMPKGTIPLLEAVEKYEQAVNVLEYIDSRGMLLSDCEWMWSPEYPTRFLVPFIHRDKIVGFGGRRYDKGPSKYYTERPVGYVYGLDSQPEDRKYVIVCEGLLDAITINGVSILGSELNATHVRLINSLNREVIYVPDRDKSGRIAAQEAANNGWSIAFPSWDSDIKDINQASVKYGRLLTLMSIVTSAVSSKIKIHLLSKKWFPKEVEQ